MVESLGGRILAAYTYKDNEKHQQVIRNYKIFEKKKVDKLVIFSDVTKYLELCGD